MLKRTLLLSLAISFIFLCTVKAQQKVPGVVVDYQPASSKKYIGSPSLIVLPNGNYIASHDVFGPNSSSISQAITKIFCSTDKGKSWKQISTIRGAFWNSLFVHEGNLFLLGPDREYGSVMIRKSSDGGKTWTKPRNKKNGVLLSGEYHCAPVPVIEYKGRLWRPMETAYGPVRKWGKRFGAMVMSAPVGADLLKARSWQTSSVLLYDSTYLNGNFGGWLEGNFVVDKENRMWNILRVDDRSTLEEKAAMIRISDDGKRLSFNPETGFIDFPGGSKKFVIKFDSTSGYYWTLVNAIPEAYQLKHPDKNPSAIRNVLMLRKSKNLKDWEDVQIILQHDDVKHFGFQYVDWLFEEDDIIVLSRTAYFDGKHNAHSAHDANFLTFHRIKNFRDL